MKLDKNNIDQINYNGWLVKLGLIETICILHYAMYGISQEKDRSYDQLFDDMLRARPIIAKL